MLEVRNIHKKFIRGKKVIYAVRGITFHINRGEIVCLLGPNGAGKTTTLRMISTIIPPDKGEIYIKGYSAVREPRKVREHIAYMAQEPDLNPYLNVRENIKYYMEMHRGSQITSTELKRILEKFDLADHWYKKPIQLSTGLKRRVQIACILSADKDLLFLDEPTTGLDVLNRRKTLEYIKENVKSGKTILLTTHILDEAEYLARRVIIISNGKIVVDKDISSLKKKFRRVLRIWTLKKVTPEIINMISKIEGVFSVKYEDKCLVVEILSLQSPLRMLLEVLKGTEISDMSIEGSKFENVYLGILEGGADYE